MEVERPVVLFAALVHRLFGISCLCKDLAAIGRSKSTEAEPLDVLVGYSVERRQLPSLR